MIVAAFAGTASLLFILAAFLLPLPASRAAGGWRLRVARAQHIDGQTHPGETYALALSVVRLARRLGYRFRPLAGSGGGAVRYLPRVLYLGDDQPPGSFDDFLGLCEEREHVRQGVQIPEMGRWNLAAYCLPGASGAAYLLLLARYAGLLRFDMPPWAGAAALGTGTALLLLAAVTAVVFAVAEADAGCTAFEQTVALFRRRGWELPEPEARLRRTFRLERFHYAVEHGMLWFLLVPGAGALLTACSWAAALAPAGRR